MITDFQSFDRIELLFDANTDTAANDQFIFIGTDATFSERAGELRARSVADNLIVEADVTGDGTADFSIMLLHGNNFALTADVFGL